MKLNKSFFRNRLVSRGAIVLVCLFVLFVSYYFFFRKEGYATLIPVIKIALLPPPTTPKKTLASVGNSMKNNLNPVNKLPSNTTNQSTNPFDLIQISTPGNYCKPSKGQIIDDNNNCCKPNQQDCKGICGGATKVDCKGICGGSNQNFYTNGIPQGCCLESEKDCAGKCAGGAVVDCAGVCNGSSKNLTKYTTSGVVCCNKNDFFTTNSGVLYCKGPETVPHSDNKSYDGHTCPEGYEKCNDNNECIRKGDGFHCKNHTSADGGQK